LSALPVTVPVLMNIDELGRGQQEIWSVMGEKASPAGLAALTPGLARALADVALDATVRAVP
jgi:hypothetical protein